LSRNPDFTLLTWIPAFAELSSAKAGITERQVCGYWLPAGPDLWEV